MVSGRSNMFKILADTCVWLDMAKEPQQQLLLSVLEELIKGLCFLES